MFMGISPQTDLRMKGFANQLGMLVATTLLGYAFYRQQDVIHQGLQYLWDRVGWVMLGLLPLSIYLLFAIGRMLIAGKKRHDESRNRLDKVLFAAPLLGMLGTVLGLTDALMQFYRIEGTENLMEVLSEFLRGASLMLYTTAWGLLLALPAGLLKKHFFPEPSMSQLVAIMGEQLEEMRAMRQELAMVQDFIQAQGGCDSRLSWSGVESRNGEKPRGAETQGTPAPGRQHARKRPASRSASGVDQTVARTQAPSDEMAESPADVEMPDDRLRMPSPQLA